MRSPLAKSAWHDDPSGIEAALRIRAEQVAALYRSLPGTLAAAVLVASIIGGMLYDRLGASVLPWVASVYILSAVRLVLWFCFVRSAPATQDLRRWGLMAIAFTGVSGVLWGLSGTLLLVPDSLAHQLFVLVTTTGLAFTSTFMTAALLPASLACLIPCFALASIPFFFAGGLLHVTIGALTLASLLLVIRFALRVSRNFSSSVRVRLQNSELVAELRRQKDCAEEANIAKSRFLAVASHDLRQPLHALGLFVHALQESALAVQERQIVGNIRRSVDAMEELFDALLDISRLDAGTVRPRLETFGLAALFERLRFEYGPIAEQKGLSLRVMPTCAFVRSDPSLLARVVRNLVANAVRYTDRGGLVLGCRRQGRSIRIEVWDSGRGIPTHKQREIFREFTQLDGADHAARKGLGLGLAIAERLARLLNHPLDMRSVPGRGSVFSITVPRGREEDLITATGSELPAAFDLSGVLILVVDHEPAVCQAMEALLGKWHCDVITARSGTEMKEKLATVRQVPDLIIADYRPRAVVNPGTRAAPLAACPPQMGAAHALAVVEMLRSEFNTEVPALLLTADTGGDRLARDREVGGLPVLQKPLNPARLRTLMANLLRSDRTRERSRRAS
ncbi:MAG TPA: hybrid sensor histidine kinase/response regulator [Steroidobacteraceae bacterium]|nr:hybrid sensor histidine kinase/response regulator [Steroidobacteraceae bacterium]